MNRDAITSVQNPRIKALVQLRRSRSKRGGVILIDGLAEIERAMDAGVAIDAVFHCPALTDAAAGALLNRAIGLGADVTEVSQSVFARIAYGDREDGVVATAARPQRRLDDLRPADPALVAVVEGVEKPGNLGAICRSADAFGVDAVLALDPACDVYGPNVIRAALGTVFCVPVVECTFDEAVSWLGARGLTIVAADPSAERPFTALDLTGPVTFVFGSEAAGLSPRWRDLSVARARVPMHGRADSLNVSVTAALFLHEARRQRTPAP